MAIPDHPWTKATKDAAAVRIAMTVAERGSHTGELREVTSEAQLDSDEPDISFAVIKAELNPNLTTGVSANLAIPLVANEGLSCNGMMLAGQGYKALPEKANSLAREEGKDVSSILRGYIGGRELLRGSANFSVIDFAVLRKLKRENSFRCFTITYTNR